MPRVRNQESYIHDETLKDLIAAHLYATTLLNDNEEVLSLTIGLPNADGIRPIQYTYIKNKEVELIVHS